MEIRSRTLIPLFTPGSVHSSSAGWDDCGVFPEESCVSSFPDRFPNRGVFSALRLRWVKDVCVFRCILPRALLAEWPRSFTCPGVTRGWNGHRIRVSTQSWLFKVEDVWYGPNGTLWDWQDVRILALTKPSVVAGLKYSDESYSREQCYIKTCSRLRKQIEQPEATRHIACMKPKHSESECLQMCVGRTCTRGRTEGLWP